MTERDINKKRLELALEAAGLDLWENNLVTGEVTYRAVKTFTDLGYTEVEALAFLDDLYRIIHTDDVPRVQSAIDNHLKGLTEQYRCEFRIRARDGSWVWYANYGKIMDFDDEPKHGKRFIGVTFNIHDRKCREELLAMREMELRTLVENSPNTISRYDRECRRTYVNPSFCAMAEGGMDALLGKMPSEYPGGAESGIFEQKIRQVFESGEDVEFELNWNEKDGKEICSLIRLTAERDLSGEITTVLAVGHNITQLNAQRKMIHEMAFYDPLTRLPNRRLLLDRFHLAQISSERSGRNVALLLIDLDNFKMINDTLGHDKGDILLQQVAKRLLSCVRDADTVARFGGDEFVVILEDLSKDSIKAAAQTKDVSEKIFAELSCPYKLGAIKYRNSASIGAVLFSGQQMTTEELLKQADIAMYEAKHAGNNMLRFFDQNMQISVNRRAFLENELHKAIENRNFQLYYQVQVDGENRPLGAEALIRWVDADHNVEATSGFISLAEETDLILEIGQWVLETACTQIKAWAEDERTANLVLSVNVSARQFHQSDFVARVLAAVHRHGINPKRLMLELTESLLLEDIEEIIVAMNALNEIGIRFALDDFGIGYSSLQYLKRLPLDQLKIDRSFIRDIAANDSDRAIVSTIIAMAQNLNLDVIAEGVETEVQRQFLLEKGCNHFQGFLFCKPVPIEQFQQAIVPVMRRVPLFGESVIAKPD